LQSPDSGQREIFLPHDNRNHRRKETHRDGLSDVQAKESECIFFVNHKRKRQNTKTNDKDRKFLPIIDETNLFCS
jgi:hypothetical protein